MRGGILSRDRMSLAKCHTRDTLYHKVGKSQELFSRETQFREGKIMPVQCLHLEVNPIFEANGDETHWCENCGAIKLISKSPKYDSGWKLPKIHSSIIFKGWTCTRCGIFNGEEKEKRNECRTCGLSKQAVHG